MTPAARLQAAMDVLAQWQTGVPVERALTGWARGARYAGSKDRRAVRDHVYDVLRQKGSCERAGGGDNSRALILGLAVLQGLSEGLFSGDGYGPERLGLQEAQIFQKICHREPARDTPDWLRDALVESVPGWAEIEQALGDRAPVYLRVNLSRASRAEVREQLAADGVETEPLELSTALQVTAGAPRVTQSRAFADGLVEPQDLSVQMACAAVDWPKGPILDYCAGGGGKALAIAAATGCAVDVHDAHPARMADIPERASRAGASLRIVSEPNNRYDLVLTDVPCSGSGTWRRDPEAKWRLTPARLSELTDLQAGILDKAAVLTDRLVYMTCSFLRAENSEQIEAFMARHSGWSLAFEQQFTPLDASDGFYLAELHRAV